MSVEVSEVSRSFRGTLAVSRMSMSVPAGSITGLVGPNGAGKTTLLLMLAALLRPDSGTIRVAGLDPVTQPREVHLAVGWMPDAFGTWDSLTCTEILSTFAAAQGLGAASARERAHGVLEAVHLTDMADAPARVLSRGQKQRLGLARALIHSPSVLLLDEPAAGMDPRSRSDMRTLLRDLADQGATVLVSSHVLSELEEMVDGVVFVARGRTVSAPGDRTPSSTAAPHRDGPVAAEPSEPAEPSSPAPVRTMWRMRALNDERLRTWAAERALAAPASPGDGVRLTVPDDDAAARLLREALEAGVEVCSFAPVSGVLEQTYLALEEERR